MNNLKNYKEIPIGGTVITKEVVQPKTSGWRMGVKPQVNLSGCVNCLICWINCPDTAVLADGTDFFGFDYDYCKGCELCAEVCPTDAIQMVPEDEQVPEYGRIKGGSHENSN